MEPMDPSLGELQLRTLMTQTAVGIAATDAHGRITMLSPALLDLFAGGPEWGPEGVPEDEIAERFDLYCEDGETRLPVEDVPLARARRGETVRDLVVSARLPDGSLLFLKCNAAPLRNESGEIRGAIVLAQDVTAERMARHEQRLLRDRLLTTVNHELRTPLTTLLGNAELLLDLGEELPSPVRRLVEPMVQAGARLRHLLATVADLVDLEAQASLSRRYVDVAPLVDELAADVGGRGHPVQAEVSAPLPASVDDGRLRKALAALLDNAVTHSPPGAPVRVRASGDDQVVRVEVEDAGPGIPEHERTRLMQPFERGERADPRLSSRGLGLAVARTVALAHGGDLLLSDARPGERPPGLCATLVVPRHGSVPIRSLPVEGGG